MPRSNANSGFNMRHLRCGHLFQGRFKGILVQKDSHLLELTRYIILNPVRAKIVANPIQYSWSSYNATIGRTVSPGFLNTDWILAQFGEERKTAISRYIEFVGARHEDNIWKRLIGQIYFGTEEFAHKFQNNTPELCEEVPKAQQYPVRTKLEELLKKKEGLLLAHRDYHYTMKEIADHLGVHYTTVSKRIDRLENIKNLYFKT